MANKSQGGKQTSLRGFASMDKNMQREIASQGGRAAHRSGNAHEFTSEEARAAGRLSHKNTASRSSSSTGNRGSESGANMQGGTSEQHAAAGSHSHDGNK